MNTNEVSPDMLILARESRGLTQSALAREADVSQGNISKYESGVLKVSPEHLARIAAVLNYPAAFFSLAERRYGFGSSCTYHRKRQTLPAYEERRLLAEMNKLRIQVARLLNGVEVEATNGFHPMELEDYNGSAANVAAAVRTSWNLPMGPIDNMIRAIEGAGGVVQRQPFGTRKMDAISQWVPGLPPLFMTNVESSTDRLRYTLAHELGHIIMHRVPTGDTMEEEADQFAAEFLAPGREIGPDLTNLKWGDLGRLKAYWKISMASLIRRARDLHRITDRQYRSLYTQLSKHGYRLEEPGPLPVEEPALLNEILDLHRTEYGYSVQEMSHLLVLNEAEYRERFVPSKHGFRMVG